MLVYSLNCEFRVQSSLGVPCTSSAIRGLGLCCNSAASCRFFFFRLAIFLWCGVIGAVGFAIRGQSSASKSTMGWDDVLKCSFIHA